MGPGLYILLWPAALIGFAVIGVTLSIDLATRRGYGILGLAVLVAATLAYVWVVAIQAQQQAQACAQVSYRCGGPLIGLFIALCWLATLLAVGSLSIAGLIEMALARRWWWFVGLVAALASMSAQALLRGYFSFPDVIPAPAALSFPVNQIVYEAIPLLACAAYGLRRTWPHAQASAQ